MHQKNTGIFLTFLVALLLGYVQADNKPIVSPAQSNCSFHGSYYFGSCLCNIGYEGVICQYRTEDIAEQECEVSHECYNCEEYGCPIGINEESITVCDSMSGEFKVNDICRNISVVCYKNYECECPPGLALLGSNCFRKELVDRVGFFMIVMAVLTVLSIGFELLVHFLEHYLAHHNQKGLLGVVQGFKSELTLIGLIGLTLFMVSSSGGFEHLLETLHGSEEVIEGVHFLMFFFVVIYFFVLIFSLIIMKTVIARRFRSYERVHSETLLALTRGEDFKQRAKDLITEIGADKRLYRKNYANYNVFRKFFFQSIKAKLPDEEFAFFPFSEYMNLCMNDLMGRISGGAWIIWIAFAYFFFMDIFLKDHFGSIIARFSVVVLLGVLNVFIIVPQARMQIFLKQKNRTVNNADDEQMELLHQSPQENRIARAYQKFFVCSNPKALEILTQVGLWLSIFNAFVIVFDHDASWPMLVTAILLALASGAYIIGQLGPILAGLIYSGPNVNVQFVKEVLKRHPRADKLAIYNEFLTQKRNAKVKTDAVEIAEELQDFVQE